MDGYTLHRVDGDMVGDVASLLVVAADWLDARGMTHWTGKFNDDEVLSSLAAGDTVLLLRCRETGRPIATVTLLYSPPFYHEPADMALWQQPAARAGYVRKLAVVPDRMGRGIAAFMMREIEEFALGQGIEFLRLDGHWSFPDLVNIYTKQGYSLRGTGVCGNNFMEKRLGTER
eukprot:TRINITY_DN22535_c0_g1_i1.p1 TRINITY_DN22535_c0_g1~~TRINITY_DN22535_c0_g1_i1.p1  ORF type:complete len:174 (-),score=60.25 TRINITY_DN22535_c0_g1_i1:380-901(-)